MNHHKVTLIIDLQFGSTGKGLIAGYLAERDFPDVVINANMPNAGHTYINDEGREWIHKVLPNGIVSPLLKYVMIGPQSVFSLDQLKKEVEQSKDLLGGKTILIHRDAVILDPSHKAHEANSLSGISSTMQGSMAAAVSKMERNPDNNHRAVASTELLTWAATVKSIDGIKVKVIGGMEWLEVLYGANKILAEGAQGYSLGLNAGFWPFCTSRDCTPARFLADMGIPVGMLGKIIGTSRVHPIRVGNTPDGYSGDVYPDQKELDWSKDIGVEAEKTTVTKRDRRIFSFSHQGFQEAIMACEPTEIFLNFANYDPEFAAMLVESYPDRIRFVGFGPKRKDVLDMWLKGGK